MKTKILSLFLLIIQCIGTTYPAPTDLNGALFTAINAGDAALVSKLLDSGATVTAVNRWGQTLLQVASLKNHPTIVRALLDAGAEINAIGPQGETALHVAAVNNHAEIVLMLLQATGIKASAQTYSFETPLYLAGNDCVEAVQTLIADSRIDIADVTRSFAHASKVPSNRCIALLSKWLKEFCFYR